MPPVLDQGSLPTCLSNATSNCLKFHMNNKFQPSRLYIHYNSFINIQKGSIKKAATRGISLEDILKTFSTYKYCDERLWPYYWWRVWTVPSQKAYKDINKYRFGISITYFCTIYYQTITRAIIKCYGSYH